VWIQEAVDDDATRQVGSLSAAVRRLPWSLLQTQWLDVPIGANVGRASLTWGAFSEGFERCLRGVSLHVSQRVDDRRCLESVVTEVVVDNLHLLVSQLAEREKLDRLRVAANLLIARRAAPGPHETDGCAPGE
jgi:hypothetical protein